MIGDTPTANRTWLGIHFLRGTVYSVVALVLVWCGWEAFPKYDMQFGEAELRNFYIAPGSEGRSPQAMEPRGYRWSVHSDQVASVIYDRWKPCHCILQPADRSNLTNSESVAVFGLKVADNPIALALQADNPKYGSIVEFTCAGQRVVVIGNHHFQHVRAFNVREPQELAAFAIAGTTKSGDMLYGVNGEGYYLSDKNLPFSELPLESTTLAEWELRYPKSLCFLETAEAHDSCHSVKK